MKYCTKCGTQLNDDAKFCTKCGAKCWEQDMIEEKPVERVAESIKTSVVGNGSVVDTKMEAKSIARQSDEATNEPPRIEEKSEKKKTKLLLIIGAVAVVAIAVAVILLINKDMGTQNNEMSSASEKTAAQESMDTAEVEQKTNEVKKWDTNLVVLKDISPDSFVKYWSGAQHWGYEITKEPDGTYKVVKQTYDASREYTTETMYCTFNNGKLEYQDAVLERELYSLEPSWNDTAKITEYTNGQGYFELLGEVSIPGSNEFFETAEESTTVLGGYGHEEGSKNPPYLSHTCKKTPYASNEYVIWYSNQIPISEGDFWNMDATDIRIARNEIFARHGMIFNDEELQKHFDSCGWYNGTVVPDRFSDTVLSDVEKYNLKVIENYETNTDLSAFVKWENSVEDCYKKYGADREKYGLTIDAFNSEPMQDKGLYYELPNATMFIYEPPIPDSEFAGKGPGDAITWKGNTYIIQEAYENEYCKGFWFIENPYDTETLGAHKVDGGYRIDMMDEWSPISTVYNGSIKFDKNCIIYGCLEPAQCSIEEYAFTNHNIGEMYKQSFEYGLFEGELSMYGYIVSMKDGLVTEFREIFTQ